LVAPAADADSEEDPEELLFKPTSSEEEAPLVIGDGDRFIHIVDVANYPSPPEDFDVLYT
jgi:hypothetical protein